MNQLVLNILVAAGLNLLLAISFYWGYHTTRFFNLSHAVLPTCAAYLLLFGTTVLKLPIVIAAAVGVIAAIGVALALEKLLFAPLRRRGLEGWQLLVASLGAYIVLINGISAVFGDETRTVGLVSVRREMLDASASDVRLLTIVIGLLGYAFMAFLLQRTTIGRAIRAVGSNPELAEIVGVSRAKSTIWAIGLGGIYAGVSGILASLDTDITPGMGFRLLINGVITMILAGVGNLRGLMAGALLLAAGQHLVAYFFDSKWMDTIAFLILIGFLIWKPLGISGRRLKKVEV